MGILSGLQYQQLTDILVNAFPSPAKLEQMVRFRLGKNLNAIALGDDLQEIVFKLIKVAEAEDWTTRLIATARESNPGNSDLLAFAQQFGLAPTNTPSRSDLERIIRDTNSFLDISRWREKLGEVEAQVCRIEIRSNKGMICGTGFLLGSSVVITNYHVMEAVILTEKGSATRDGLQAAPRDVVFRFDYKQLGNGAIISQGKTYQLAQQDWLLSFSPYSTQHDPSSNELDYALLRLDGEPGSEAIGVEAEPGAPKRGWVEVPEKLFEFLPGSPLIIVQHPEGKPLKLAIDTDAVIGLSENGTVLRYKTNTEYGSSGSPCFNIDWELVALHHRRDPIGRDSPTHNEGTPFSLILANLEKRGLRSLLGEQVL